MTIAPAIRPRRIDALTGWAFITAPVWLLAAWVIMWPLNGRDGPGTGWTIAHTAWIIGFLALGLVCRELYRRAKASTTSALLPAALAGLTLVGLVAGVVQMAVDLVAGFQTSTYDEMQARSNEITSAPGVDFVLYTLSPVLVFLGLIALLTLLAARRQTSPVNPVLVLLTFVLIGIDDSLTPVGLACLGLAIAPIGWKFITHRQTVRGLSAAKQPAGT